MGYPIIIRHRVELKPSPRKRLPVRGSRACADVPRRRGHGRADEHLPSTARVHRRARRRCGVMAAGGAGETGVDAGGSLPEFGSRPPELRPLRPRLFGGACPSRVRLWPKPGDRIPPRTRKGAPCVSRCSTPPRLPARQKKEEKGIQRIRRGRRRQRMRPAELCFGYADALQGCHQTLRLELLTIQDL